MTPLLIIACAFVATVLLGTVLFASWCSRDGYEDDAGFHFDSRSTRHVD